LVGCQGYNDGDDDYDYDTLEVASFGDKESFLFYRYVVDSLLMMVIDLGNILGIEVKFMKNKNFI